MHFDSINEEIATYLVQPQEFSTEAYDTARLCLADALGCALLALRFPECCKLLGPIVPGMSFPQGCPIPGTQFVLDPLQAAFNMGTMIRWLDFNDTWLAAEWGHPSDNLGCLLALSHYVSTQKQPIKVKELLTWMIQVYEIHGVLALQNSFNQIGIDHVILVKVASAAVGTKILGGSREQILNSLSNAWIDFGPLRTYRHFPYAGSRKSWAAGDATSRGVFFSLLALRNEMGYPGALNAKKWGLNELFFKTDPLTLPQTLGSYVMENILFKVLYPAEFHAQTAVEAAIALHPMIKDKWDQIASIEIATQEAARRIIDKQGPLHTPAARDHCLQYMVAIGLLYGTLSADHYSDKTAEDLRIDLLRNKMVVHENEVYSRNYLDPSKRSIANAIKIKLNDGQIIGPIEVAYPLGHRLRRSEALPLILRKFYDNIFTQLPKYRAEKIYAMFGNRVDLCTCTVPELLSLFAGG